MSETKLIDAIRNGRKRRVLQMVAGGLGVNEVDDYGRSPLHWAVQETDLDLIEALLASHSDVNGSDNLGFTPLCIAVGENSVEAARALLRSGADANVRIRGNQNGTPLHLASAWGNSEMVRILLNCGRADVNAKDDDGKTPLDYAREAGDREVIATLEAKQS